MVRMMYAIPHDVYMFFLVYTICIEDNTVSTNGFWIKVAHTHVSRG